LRILLIGQNKKLLCDLVIVNELGDIRVLIEGVRRFNALDIATGLFSL